MNARLPNTFELLSAYHDGELTAAERESVERLLEESAEARRELAEIAQVSGLLNELPSNRLPADFRARVLVATERAMLLPPPEEPNGQSAGSANGRRTAAWAGLAGLLAAAASVTIAVVLLRPRETHEQFAARAPLAAPNADTADRGSPPGDDDGSALAARARRGRESAESHGPSRESGDADRAIGGRAGDEIAAAREASAPAEEPANEAGRFGRDPADPAASSHAASGQDTRNGATLRIPGSSLRLSRREIAAAEIGDVIDAIDTGGDGIAVVRVTVVDREAGIGAARLLLAPQTSANGRRKSQQSPARTPAPPSADAAEYRYRDPGAAIAERLTANVFDQPGGGELLETVIVQATPEQLSALLDELHDASGVRELAVERPIELARLDDAAKRRLADEWRSLDDSHATPPAADEATDDQSPPRGASDRSDSVRTPALAGPDDAASEGQRDVAPRAAPQAVADRAEGEKEPAARAADPVAPGEAALPGQAKSGTPTAGADASSAPPPTMAKQVAPSFSQHLLRSRDGRDSPRATPGGFRRRVSPAEQDAAAAPRAQTSPPSPPAPEAPADRPAKGDFPAESDASAEAAATTPGRPSSMAARRRVQVLFLLVGDRSGR